MSYIFLIIMLVLAFLVIAYPFLAGVEVSAGRQVTEDAKAQVLATLNEIEFDYQTNKLSDADYHELREKFERATYQLYQREDQQALREQEGES